MPGARRTQGERRSQTQAKLLDATIQSLLDVGYAATTTRRVSEVAGVSAGALSHHYPHRVDLVAAATERLVERRVEQLGQEMRRLPSDSEARAAALLDLMWGDFSSPVFRIFVKLWIAAADDHELYERLIPLEQRLSRNFTDLIPIVTRSDGGPEDIRERFLLVLAALRGLALTRAFEPAARPPVDPWPMLRPVLVRVLNAD